MGDLICTCCAIALTILNATLCHQVPLRLQVRIVSRLLFFSSYGLHRLTFIYLIQNPKHLHVYSAVGCEVRPGEVKVRSHSEAYVANVKSLRYGVYHQWLRLKIRGSEQPVGFRISSQRGS